MSNTVLDTRLQHRQNKIDNVKRILKATQELFDKFGSQELKTSHAKFAELEKALDSNEVRLVVIGEFSRGKSSLVNALLGIHLLRSAQEATTAINTFVKSLPKGESEKYILIHFQDGRSPQKIAWHDDSVLEQWSTELDSSHADARKMVDYIEVFMSHPLLDKGLILVDTPGLQSVVEHHELITRKAIAEAHIAIWVQSTQQLGGNATEWAFLSETISKNFRKFVTVINMWDAVLEPTDFHEQNKPESQRVREKLDRVRTNFKEKLTGKLSDSDLIELTDDNHLLGVSALWALGKDEIKKQRSGVNVLAEKISSMFDSGEAMEQIYLKPLQQLSNIQEQLRNSMIEELNNLSSNDTEAERQRDLQALEQEIKNLQLEMRNATNESKNEHRRIAEGLAKDIEKELVNPLADLKAKIELNVTPAFVARMVDQKQTKIALPDDLHQEFERVTEQVGDQWNQQKQKMLKLMEDLRNEYSDKMSKHAHAIKADLADVKIEIPTLNINLNLDLSGIEDHHKKAMELQRSIAEQQRKIDELESEIAKNSANTASIENARRAVQQAERRLVDLGGQPQPITYTRHEQIKEKGIIWGDAEYADITYRDDSNVNDWKSQRGELNSMLANREKELQRIIDEEHQKSGIRISAEKAQKRFDTEIKKLEREQRQAEEQAKNQRQDLIQEITNKLIFKTAGELDQRIKYLQGHLKESIKTVFDNQMQLLEDCIKEQFIEPINAKKAKLEEVDKLLKQDKITVENYKQELGQAQQTIEDILQVTQSALKMA